MMDFMLEINLNGNRVYLYVFKLTLFFENGLVDETYIPTTSHYYDRTTKYILGYVAY